MSAERDARLVLMSVLDDGPLTLDFLARNLGFDSAVAVDTLAAAGLVQREGGEVAATDAARTADQLLGGTV